MNIELKNETRDLVAVSKHTRRKAHVALSAYRETGDLNKRNEYVSLHLYRTTTLRSRARIIFLARAFLSGKRRSTVEKYAVAVESILLEAFNTVKAYDEDVTFHSFIEWNNEY